MGSPVTRRPVREHRVGVHQPRGLWNRGFLSLLLTQFFEAATDNLIKGGLSFAVAVGAPWEKVFGEGGNGVVGLAFSVPFILLSALGGRVADRSSKSRITVTLKAISFAVAALAAFSFAWGSPWAALGALTAFAVVSAFFGPVKYGMIAELVGEDQLARANGVINMTTNIAVIVGVLVAGLVSARWKTSFVGSLPSGSGAWLPGIGIFVAVTLGFLTCLTLPKLSPQNPTLAMHFNPFSIYLTTIKWMANTRLLAIAGAWTFFYFVAAIVLLILPDYSAFLDIPDSETAYLMAGLAVSIGAGCLIAAYADTPGRRILFVPFGAVGLALTFGVMGMRVPQFGETLGLLSVTGFFAGFYIIPLQSLLQTLAPSDRRGRVLGTANGMSFFMSAVGSALFLGLRHLGMPSNRIFLVLAGLCGLVAVVTVWLLRPARRQASPG